MDSDPRDIQELLKITRENNKMLHSLQRRARFSLFMSLIRWAIIILVSFGAYIYIQPYLQRLLDIYTQVNESAGLLNSAGESLKFDWNQFKNLVTPGTGE